MLTVAFLGSQFGLMAEGYLRDPPFGNGLTQSARMFPSVIGGPAGCLGFDAMLIERR